MGVKKENNNFELNIIIKMIIDTNNTAHQNKQKSK